MNQIYAQHTVTVTELKKSPSTVLTKSGGMPVAVLTNNVPSYYIVGADEYQEMMMTLEAFQRGTSQVDSVPGKFVASKEKVASVSAKVLNKVTNDTAGECVEC